MGNWESWFVSVWIPRSRESTLANQGSVSNLGPKWFSCLVGGRAELSGSAVGQFECNQTVSATLPCTCPVSYHYCGGSHSDTTPRSPQTLRDWISYVNNPSNGGFQDALRSSNLKHKTLKVSVTCSSFWNSPHIKPTETWEIPSIKFSFSSQVFLEPQIIMKIPFSHMWNLCSVLLLLSSCMFSWWNGLLALLLLHLTAMFCYIHICTFWTICYMVPKEDWLPNTIIFH